MVPPEEITKKVNEIIAKYFDTSAVNLNKLRDGSSVNRSTASNAIAIQDFVKRLNGSGLKVTYIFFLLLKIMADILKFTDIPIIYESIEEYQYHEYESVTFPSLKNGSDFRISIESQDVFTHPSERYLIFEGRLTKGDGTPHANADEVALTNNAIMHLFSRIEVHLARQLIESPTIPVRQLSCWFC